MTASKAAVANGRWRASPQARRPRREVPPSRVDERAEQLPREIETERVEALLPHREGVASKTAAQIEGAAAQARLHEPRHLRPRRVQLTVRIDAQVPGPEGLLVPGALCGHSARLRLRE